MKLIRQNPGGSTYLEVKNKLGLREGQGVIATWGYPDPEILKNELDRYPDHLLVDLDIYYGAPETKVLPDNYCRIITNIIDNALLFKDDIAVIVASVGEEKCDQGRFASYILEQLGLNVIKTRFYKSEQIIKPVIATSQLPLKDKVLLIMDSLFNPALLKKYKFEETEPINGFWGVPPNDLSVLELFPDHTHVYGWTRSVEARRPADLDYEMFVDEKVPTVFFAQTFCAKMQLAKFLAKKHDGLYVDIDDYMNVSVRAKIEAFLRLS